MSAVSGTPYLVVLPRFRLAPFLAVSLSGKRLTASALFQSRRTVMSAADADNKDDGVAVVVRGLDCSWGRVDEGSLFGALIHRATLGS